MMPRAVCNESHYVYHKRGRDTRILYCKGQMLVEEGGLRTKGNTVVHSA